MQDEKLKLYYNELTHALKVGRLLSSMAPGAEALQQHMM